VPEATVSGSHAVARWQAGSWVIEDVGSTNGTYADHSFDRKKTVALLHGGDVLTPDRIAGRLDQIHHRRRDAEFEVFGGLPEPVDLADVLRAETLGQRL
jgi:pSer/pThr/pTyr-binding forkhead associated (FHA) protein